MMSKRNIALLVLLFVQILWIANVYRPDRHSGPARVSFFKDIAADRITGLAITGEEGEILSLAKVKEGWVIRSADNLPVDSKKLDKLLSKLVALSSDRLVTRTTASHSRFRVAEGRFNQKVSLTLADGSERAIFLGTAPSYKSTHVRVAGEDPVYLVTDFSSWEVSQEPSAWWKQEYVDIDERSLKQVRISNDHGELVLTWKDDGWQVEGLADGKAADSGRIEDLISRACRVNLTEYLGRDQKDEFRLDKPRARLTLQTADATVTLAIGAKDADDNTHVMKSSASEFYVRGSDFALAPILEADHEKLRQAESGKQTP